MLQFLEDGVQLGLDILEARVVFGVLSGAPPSGALLLRRTGSRCTVVHHLSSATHFHLLQRVGVKVELRAIQDDLGGWRALVVKVRPACPLQRHSQLFVNVPTVSTLCS